MVKINLSPSRELKKIREKIRKGEFQEHTRGVCPNHVPTNVVILPKDLAFDFLKFCAYNPKPFPLLDVTDVGDPMSLTVAPGADLRTDVPKYRVIQKGEVEEPVTNIRDYWRDDFVGFILGCSLGFEKPLLDAGVPLRIRDEGKLAPTYVTNIPCEKSGSLKGNHVVSMRPIPSELVSRTVSVTLQYPLTHGSPMHIGAPKEIGIDLDNPEVGERITLRSNEVPVFWACGATSLQVAKESKPEIMITHDPGCMFITNLRVNALRWSSRQTFRGKFSSI